MGDTAEIHCDLPALRSLTDVGDRATGGQCAAGSPGADPRRPQGRNGDRVQRACTLHLLEICVLSTIPRRSGFVGASSTTARTQIDRCRRHVRRDRGGSQPHPSNGAQAGRAQREHRFRARSRITPPRTSRPLTRWPHGGLVRHRQNGRIPILYDRTQRLNVSYIDPTESGSLSALKSAIPRIGCTSSLPIELSHCDFRKMILRVPNATTASLVAYE